MQDMLLKQFNRSKEKAESNINNRIITIKSPKFYLAFAQSENQILVVVFGLLQCYRDWRGERAHPGLKMHICWFRYNPMGKESTLVGNNEDPNLL